jgi:hypothetical protein
MARVKAESSGSAAQRMTAKHDAGRADVTRIKKIFDCLISDLAI